MGDANASIPTPQPILPRPMFGAFGAVPAKTSLAFVAAGRHRRRARRRASRSPADSSPVADTRNRGKADLPLNDALPRIEVDPDTFTVRVDGEVFEPEPPVELPMAQRYFLF